jgi:hypothetical protein
LYAYLRPRQDENVLGVINFSGNTGLATVSINETDLRLTTPLADGVTCYLNDVLNDTSYQVTKSSLTTFGVELPAWGLATFVLADTVINLVTSVAVSADPALPERFALLQNYPNPFNPSTTISFGLAKRSEVKLEIYNVIGQKVRTFVSESRPAGDYTIEWDGKNDFGFDIGSGVYLVTMRAHPAGEQPFVHPSS